jgi:hypothetical protein
VVSSPGVLLKTCAAVINMYFSSFFFFRMKPVAVDFSWIILNVVRINWVLRSSSAAEVCDVIKVEPSSKKKQRIQVIGNLSCKFVRLVA